MGNSVIAPNAATLTPDDYSYYTPSPLTDALLGSALDPVLNETAAVPR
ncbi:MAG: hypothetical protein ACRDSL_05505 [Pseudonocardiaceae bacterium]